MTVQSFENFLASKLEALRTCISPSAGLNWPQVAQAANEARDAIISFVESEMRNQISVKNATTKNTTADDEPIDLANNSGYNYDRPFSRCSLRSVRSSLYRLACVIRPYIKPEIFTGIKLEISTGTVGTWYRHGFSSNCPIFSLAPYRQVADGAGYVDQWFISLSHWLSAFITGIHFSTAQNAYTKIPSIFSYNLQVEALTDKMLDSFILIEPPSDGTKWEEVVIDSTDLMTLFQSLDTLLELPELRLGILCANYLKKLEGLLSDAVDYNIDLTNSSNDVVTHYVRGKMRLIAEFAKQELETLNNLCVKQILVEIKVNQKAFKSLNRTFTVPSNVRTALSQIP